MLHRYLEETVLPFSKHYGALGNDLRRIRCVEDLRHLPFTTKKDVQDPSCARSGRDAGRWRNPSSANFARSS